MLSALLPLQCLLRAPRAEDQTPVRGREEWLLQRFPTAAALRAAWPAPDRADGFWLQRETLSFLTDHPQGMETEAVLLTHKTDDRQVLLTTQSFSFSAAGQVKDAAKGKTSGWDLRRRLLGPFSFRVLSIGQFLTSGAFATDGLERLSPAEAGGLLPAVADTLMRLRPGYAAAILKDLYPTAHPAVRELRSSGHYLLPADPVMELAIPAEWATFDDYLASLTSKYRVRYRRARTKLEGIASRPLTAEEVFRRRDRFHELYCSVSNGADFNAANLKPDYFPWLAEAVARKASRQATLVASGVGTATAPEEAAACITGYFNEARELIGFTSSVPNNETLHAHFLGFETKYKSSHHLYHNMLFDLLEQAIAGGFRHLDYGRTALEIKSSVGAQATNYAVLVKARYGWLNRLIPVFTPAVYTAPGWVERNPFRR